MATPSPISEDLEKGIEKDGMAVDTSSDRSKHSARAPSSTEIAEPLGRLGLYLNQFERQLIKYNLEARGVQRVEPHETHAQTWKAYIQAFLMWISVNLAAVNITLGMLAPTVYYLSFKDAALCAAFGSLLGSLVVAYIVTWGPVSGNRTMIFTRYTFGWWPSKLIVLLNLIVLLGYSMIDLVVAGQMLSAVSSDGHLSVVVGIIVVAVIGWVITTFGISIYHMYMRYAWLPQLVAISILYGVSASQFDLATPTAGDHRTRVGNRLSFFSLCFSAAITYAGGAADVFVYYPPSTPRLPLFFVSLLGLVSSFSFALIVGIGLGSGVTSNAAYSAAYASGQGNLIVEGFSSLNGFGKFLGVVIALGLIANTIFPTYSSGIDFQILGRAAQKVPRFIWNTFGVIIYTVCALAGRDHLSEVFTNFLALMGYWLAIWIAIILEEQIIFRRRTGYDWTVWNQQNKLPMGIAALIAFLVGWVGAILCMAQVWYIGPIAKQVGEYGADVCFRRLLSSIQRVSIATLLNMC
ncbi:MAG: hypothetical protein ALECFALPRED_007942 [Alectoria fallacina]|uniref:Uncharacterized protein n=1 Tax=Alectoria fallacina TaxID=1903189 RepID=A0A8H3J1Q2_9LECA|nr:MAG: hypothetical protein ALECFALPRED_007942 [Alectoria fallacina]